MDPNTHYDANPAWPPIDEPSHHSAPGEDEQQQEHQSGGGTSVDPALDPMMEDHLQQLRHDLSVDGTEKEAGGESFDDGMEDAAAASPAIEHPSGSTGAQHHHHPATTPLAFHHLVHPNSTEDGTSGTAPAERPSLPPVQYTPGPFNPYPDPASGAVSSQTTMASYPQPYPHAPVLPGAASAQQKQEQPIASSSRQESTPSGSASIAANTHKRPSPSSVSLRAAGKASTSVAGPSSLDSEAGDPTGGSVAAGGGADDAHDDKRRKLKRAEQNRQAQRNFRERREKHIADLEAKARTLHLAQVNELDAQRRLRMANVTIGELRAENANLRETIERLSAELSAAAVAAAMGGEANGASATESTSAAVDDDAVHQEMEGTDEAAGLDFAPGDHEAELGLAVHEETDGLGEAGEMVDELEAVEGDEGDRPVEDVQHAIAADVADGETGQMVDPALN